MPEPQPNLNALPSHVEKMLGEARMAVWRWDPDRDVGTSSPLMNELWGLKPGQNLQDSELGYSLIHPDDIERQRELVANAVAQAGSWHNEFRILRPIDGRIAWLEERAHATRDAQTGKLYIEGVTWDVSERHEAKRAHGDSEHRYQTLFHSIDEGFAIWQVLYDAAGNPRDALLLENNTRFDEILGVKNVEGKTNLEIFPGTEPSWFEIYRDVAKSGSSQRFEKHFGPLDRWFEVGVSAVGPQQPDQVAVVFNDITARRKTEDALRASEEKYRTLFNSIDEGFAIWQVLYDESGDPVDALILEGNSHFKALPGHQSAIGKTSREVFPEAENWWIQSFHEVLAGGVPVRFERYFDPIDRWLEIHLCPLGPSFLHQVTVVFTDVTERRQNSETLRASEEKYRTLFNSIDEGFCLVEMIFDAAGKPVDFLYLEVNPGFVRQAGFDPMGKRVREVLPDYEQVLLDHYARALASDEVIRLEHPVKGLESHWFRTTAFRYGDASSRRVAIVFTNITEERKAAEALREGKSRTEFLIRLEDALRPIEDPTDIQTAAARLLGEYLATDRVYYADIDEAAGVAEIPPGYARGELPSIAAKYPLGLFDEALRPLRKGEVLNIPDVANEPDHPRDMVETFKAWGAGAVLAAPLMKEGNLRWALSVLHGDKRAWTEGDIALVRETAERTWAAVSRAQSEKDLRASEQKYHALFDSIEEGFCLLQLFFDEEGNAVDYEYLETNPAFVRQAGMEMQGHRIKELIPDFEQSWIDAYGRVALTGESVREENKVTGLDRWFQTTAFRHGAPENRQVAVVFTNVTDRKNAEQNLLDFNARLDMLVRSRTAELKENRDLLQSVFDTSLVGMAYLQAVRDDDGKVVDFVIRMLNKELERESGRDDLLGRYYGQELPGIHASGLFKIMVEALESGKPKGMEYFYPHDGFNKWFSSMFVKFEDGLVATNLDITAQKKSELDLKTTLSALELENKIHSYAEEIALMGTWTWNTATNRLTYSDNLYRLFGMEPRESPPPLEEITRAIHPDDRARVQESSEQMVRTGERPVVLEYRTVREDGTIRTFTNRVQKVGDLEGGYLLVGITEDITERKRTEDRNVRMRLERTRAEERQRLALLAATLNTQEAERRRISESLHNGIGQMLYGTQLNLNLLDLKPGEGWRERHAEQLKRTTRLLSEAINEVRRVSHELMPSVLEDFGLKAAVDEICKQFHGRLNVDCKHSLLPENIPQYVSIAIYRTLQELMTNVVKHAEAGRVQVAVRHDGGMYELEVVDDGMGFDVAKPVKGIGLKTLREKIALLKGELHLDSGEAGTKIRVRIPDISMTAA